MKKKNKFLFIATLSTACLLSLASCQGAQGPKGDQGTPGINGTNGTDGTNGTNGSSVLTGSGVPASSLGQDGDSYIDTDTFDFYSKKSGSWSKVGNIKGNTGETGSTGSKGEDGKSGTSLLSGSGVPSSELGSDGDSYIDTDTFDFYSKSNGEWKKYGNFKGTDGSKGEDGTKGEDGKSGTSILTGNGEPASTLGSDGDSYIDTSSFDFYTKADGSWSKVGSIKGEKGDAGEKGDKGNSGWSGSKGDTAWSNTIVPSSYGYVTVDLASATVNSDVTFTMHPLSKEYTASLLELTNGGITTTYAVSPANDGNQKQLQYDSVNKVYYATVKMVEGGYCARGVFIEIQGSTNTVVIENASSDYGEITLNKAIGATYDINEEVIITITPKGNYDLDTLTVGNISITDGTEGFTKNQDGTYTYKTKMVSEGLKVVATWKEKSSVTTKYTLTLPKTAGNSDITLTYKVYKSDDTEITANSDSTNSEYKYTVEKGETIKIEIIPSQGTLSYITIDDPSGTKILTSDERFSKKNEHYCFTYTIGEKDVAIYPGFEDSDDSTNIVSINSVDDLVKFRENFNTNPNDFNGKTVKLTNTEYKLSDNWIPITTKGKTLAEGFNFTFDGNGATIKNLKIEKGSDTYVGFFEIIESCTIQKLNFYNAKVIGNDNVGVLAGFARNVTISNCTIDESYAEGKVNGDTCVGMFIGQVGEKINISSCKVKGNNTISGNDYLGGFIGNDCSSSRTYSSNVLEGTLTFKLIATVGNTREFIGNKENPTGFTSTATIKGLGDDQSQSTVSISSKNDLKTFFKNLRTDTDASQYADKEIKVSDSLKNSEINISELLDSGEKWTPIYSTINFTFDGNGITIKGLTIDSSNSKVGFFGEISNCTIKNLNFTNANITGFSHVGVIAGCASNVEINSCKISGSTVYAKASNNDGGNYVGLFVGQVNCNKSEKTTITSCSINDTNTVKGIHRFAGFVGFVEDWSEDDNRFEFTSNNLNGTLKLEYDTENTYGTSHTYGSFYSNDDITLVESNKTNGSVTNPKM